MAQVPFNATFKQQQKKLVKSAFKKAVISSVNVSAGTADIYFTENPQTVIRNIPIASHIDPMTLLKGAQIGVQVFDETTPNNMVISMLIGQTPTAPPVQYTPQYFVGNFMQATISGYGNPHDVSYTGVGFKPKYIRAIVFFGGATNSGYSFGAAASNINQNDFIINTPGSSLSVYINLGEATDSSGTYYVFVKLKSFDADGFTLTWQWNYNPGGGHPTVSMMYECFA